MEGAREVHPTLEELKASLYDSANMEAALEGLHQDGFVVLKSVMDVGHIDHINNFMTKEADEITKNNPKPLNLDVESNILQGLPVKDSEYLYNDVFFNPFVIQVMNAYLGANQSGTSFTGNNALRRTKG